MSSNSDLPAKLLEDAEPEEEEETAESNEGNADSPGAEEDGPPKLGPAEDRSEHRSAPPVLEAEREDSKSPVGEEEEEAAPDLGEAQAALPREKSGQKNTGSQLTSVTIMVGSKKLRLKIVDAPPKSYRRLKAPMEDLNDDDFASGYFNENPFVCSYCGKNYSSRIKLLRHETEHTGQKPFTCNYCGKGFTHKQSLIMHERIHTGEKPFQCPICTKCFARQTNYNIHMKLHASGRRYFCSFCGKWYRTEHEMLDHQQTCLAQMHGQPVPTDKPLRYQCSYCEKMFHHRRDKNIHERTHTGERPYTCGYCGKGFTQSQALTIHIRTHTGERPYTCAICGKDFRDSSALRKHEFVKHTSIRSAQAIYGGLDAEEASVSPIMVTAEQLEAAVFAIAPNQ